MSVYTFRGNQSESLVNIRMPGDSDEHYTLTRTSNTKAYYKNDEGAAENCVVVIIGMRVIELPRRKGDIEEFFEAVGVPRNPPLAIKLILYDGLAEPGVSKWETDRFGVVDVVSVSGSSDHVMLGLIMGAAQALDPHVGTQADVVVSDYSSPSLWISEYGLLHTVLDFLKAPSKCKLHSAAAGGTGGVVFASTIPPGPGVTSGGRKFQRLKMPEFQDKFPDRIKWKYDFEMRKNEQGTPLRHWARDQLAHVDDKAIPEVVAAAGAAAAPKAARHEAVRTNSSPSNPEQRAYRSPSAPHPAAAPAHRPWDALGMTEADYNDALTAQLLANELHMKSRFIDVSAAARAR